MKKNNVIGIKTKQVKESLSNKYGEFLNKNFGIVEIKKKRNIKKNKSAKKKQQVCSPKASSNNQDLTQKISPKGFSNIRAFKSRQFLKQTQRFEKKQRKQTKININFEIKNLNIYKSALSPMKNGHKKNATGIQSIKNTTNLKKQKSKVSTKIFQPNQKKNIKQTIHRKTKSQENVYPNNFNFDKFINKQIEEHSIISKYSIRTKPGILDDKPKINQDSYILYNNFIVNNICLLGVCDGHGINGHFVSDFVKEMLPDNLLYFLFKSNCFKKLSEKNLLKSALSNSFAKTSADLSESGIDTTFSGSTTVVTFIVQNMIYCANIGDSRAVIFFQDSNYTWSSKALSIDHKAEVQTEAQRIIKSKGRLQPYRDEEGNQMGPYRVWLESAQIPGLAMTRSFGDLVASTVGVICQPQIIEYQTTKKDKFMVIASDGLWEFISNEQVMEIVVPCFLRNDVDQASKLLESRALKAWTQEDDIIDDITVVVIFFKNY